MLSLLGFVFALGIIVLVHELGHFLVAKKFGILCHEFSIGMGPAIYSKKIGETRYSLRLVPIGGYVAMAGEEVEKEMVKVGQSVGVRINSRGLVDKIYLDPNAKGVHVNGKITSVDLYKELFIVIETPSGEPHRYRVIEDAFYVFDKGQEQQIAPYNRCLESKSKFARFATMAAGATMNFILAIVLFFGVGFYVGNPTYSSVISQVEPNSPADVSGIEAGDKVVEFNGYNISNWNELIEAIQTANGETTVKVERNGEVVSLTLTPTVENGRTLIGIGVDTQNPVKVERSLGVAVEYAFENTKQAFTSIFDTFRMLFVTKEAGVGDLAGPVGIYSMTSQIVTYGFASLLKWVAFLSVNIGLLNLLPIPALDGGRIVFVLIEAIIGRPVNRRVEGYIHTAGLLLFLGLFIYITFNDVLRLFNM
ncbi:MAG TPA: RIP metalloprotease RseP [Firmicutes bacterium]|nr:RIP metalloprotease RseP [Bacillota bacterium]